MLVNRIVETFGVARVLLPVVHPVTWDDALASVAVAHDAGVKGVFLIDQGMQAPEVLRLVMTVRERWPRLWVGVNLLAYRPDVALRRALDACAGRIDGIWSDNAAVDELAADHPAAQRFVDTRRERGWNGLYFGGVAFKYQREVPPERLGRAAEAALPFVDVVCTSGPGTGKAADVAKVAALRAGLGAHGAMALASGVTAENVDDYLPYVDAYLVGTGLEASFGSVDPDKVARLQQRIAGYQP
jgi:predicted TIM-barrel enzyme